MTMTSSIPATRAPLTPNKLMPNTSMALGGAPPVVVADLSGDVGWVWWGPRVSAAVAVGSATGTVAGAASGAVLGGVPPAFTGIGLPAAVGTAVGGALIGAPIGALAGTIIVGGPTLIGCGLHLLGHRLSVPI